MGLSDWIKYGLILHKIKKAKKKGYGGFTKHYGLYLPELTPNIRAKLSSQGIKISEMQWDVKFSWRRFYWDESKEFAPPDYKLF